MYGSFFSLSICSGSRDCKFALRDVFEFFFLFSLKFAIGSQNFRSKRLNQFNALSCMRLFFGDRVYYNKWNAFLSKDDNLFSVFKSERASIARSLLSVS